MSRTISARMKTATTIPKPKRAENEAFMKLYCACLSGAASQLEQTYNNEDGRYCGDVFADHGKTLHNRECLRWLPPSRKHAQIIRMISNCRRFKRKRKPDSRRKRRNLFAKNRMPASKAESSISGMPTLDEIRRRDQRRAHLRSQSSVSGQAIFRQTKWSVCFGEQSRGHRRRDSL